MIKTNDPDFFRDEENNALINRNINAFKQYKIARQNRLSSAQNAEKIEDLESKIKELTSLVELLLKERNG